MNLTYISIYKQSLPTNKVICMLKVSELSEMPDVKITEKNIATCIIMNKNIFSGILLLLFLHIISINCTSI